MNPRLAKEIRALLEQILAGLPVDAATALYKDVAFATGGLPVYADIGGALAITPEGEIRLYDHETKEVSASVDAKWRRVALTHAAEKYPSLADLRPVTPADAIGCPHCNGTGRLLNERLRCATCVGTGWLYREAP
jgi:hypothetical protein